ncbi:hypothetical protein [Methylobacillus sp.]|nr:hypothetical protein [Methylobacillus sp.]
MTKINEAFDGFFDLVDEVLDWLSDLFSDDDDLPPNNFILA